RSWCSINSGAEDILESVMEFSERPLRGGLSVFISLERYVADVRYWHKADIPTVAVNVRFQG
ncbi:MAG: hypothetical protein WCD83_11495, partial [Pseudolabrys sp.]